MISTLRTDSLHNNQDERTEQLVYKFAPHVRQQSENVHPRTKLKRALIDEVNASWNSTWKV